MARNIMSKTTWNHRQTYLIYLIDRQSNNIKIKVPSALGNSAEVLCCRIALPKKTIYFIKKITLSFPARLTRLSGSLSPYSLKRAGFKE